MKNQFFDHIFTEEKYKSFLKRLIQSGDFKGLMFEYISIQEITTQAAMRRTVIDNSESFANAITMAGKFINAGYKPAQYSEQVYKKVFKIYD